MRSSERLQQETDSTLEEVEAFLHELTFMEDVSKDYRLRGRKLESKVKLLRAKSHLHLQRMPLSSLRVIYDPFPKDLEIKRPRSSTSPDHLFNFLPDVPEEKEEEQCGTGNPSCSEETNADNDQNHNELPPIRRPRSASFPLSL